MVTIVEHSWPKAVPPEHFQKARLVIADPPYNFGVEYADDPTGDRMPESSYFSWLAETLHTITSELLCFSGVLAWVCPRDHGFHIWDAINRNPGLKLLYGGPIVWKEAFAQYQQKTLTGDYRLVFLACNGSEKPFVFNPDEIRIPSKRQELGDKRADPRGRVPGMVWELPRLAGTHDLRVDWHKAQLAPELLTRLIKGWTNPGDTVMDAFAGSGNTLLIARGLDRKAVGFDQSPTYVEKIKERLSLV